MTKRKLQRPRQRTHPAVITHRHILHHLASRLVLFNLLHVLHVSRAIPRGAIFSSGKLSTNLCLSPCGGARRGP